MIIRNFLFHRVSDEKDDLWPPMTPELFERIIKSLMRSFNVVSLEDSLQKGMSGLTGKKTATVLFDDGYKDNIEHAAPILKKHSCPASFYVVTDCINRNIPTWTYLLDYTLQATKTEAIFMDYVQVPGELRRIALADKENVKKIKPWMKKLPNADRVQVLNSILKQCNDVPPPENKMMGWQDVNQLLQAGFHIGSHSHTHPMLAALEDEAEISEELNLSALILKEKTGAMPLVISYPIGSFDERVIRLAGQAGYKYGLAVEQKFYRYPEDNLMTIPRVELYQEPSWKVSLRMNGVYQKALAGKIARQFPLSAIVIDDRNQGPGRKKVSKIPSLIWDRLRFRSIYDSWKKLQAYYSKGFPSWPDVPILRTRNINTEETVLFTTKFHPDLIIVSGTALIKENLLRTTASIGIINLHTGLSPYVKGGPNCTNWCIANNDWHLVGNTIMWLNAGIDSGNIITSEYVAIKELPNLFEAQKKVMEHAHDLYLRAITYLLRSQPPYNAVLQNSLGKGKLFLTKMWTAVERKKLLRNWRNRKKYPPAQPAVNIQLPARHH